MVFLGGWRSKYLYQQGCPMLPATVARGYVAFSRHEKKISKTNKKTYNIQHTTLYKLFAFSLPIFSWNYFFYFSFLFSFSLSLSLSLSIVFLRRSAQRRTKEQRTIWGLPATIDRAYCNRFVNG